MFLLPHKQDEVWEAWTCLKGRAMIWFDLLAVEELVFFFCLDGLFSISDHLSSEQMKCLNVIKSR